MTDHDPLFEGLKVIDAASWIAGPVAATILADYGADVIKIEAPVGGDGYRALAAAPGMPASSVNYTWLMDARNKRSLTLNLKDPRGKAILLRLIADADVYVTNQPLAMRRAHALCYADIGPLNPRLIYASLTAYGETGPDSDREGFDLVAYWARTGLMDLVRHSDSEPSQSLPGMGDHPTAIALYAAIVTALLRRERTGRGDEVHTSLLANGLWSAACIAQARFAGADFSRWRTPDRVAFTRPVYRASDGRWLQFSMVRTAAEIAALFEVVGLQTLLDEPRFATPEARLANGTELVEQLRLAVGARDSSSWLRAFHLAGVPAATVGNLDDLCTDPQLSANSMTLDVDAARFGTDRLINHPVNIARSGLSRRRDRSAARRRRDLKLPPIQPDYKLEPSRRGIAAIVTVLTRAQSTHGRNSVSAIDRFGTAAHPR
jgi:crotonobetainyl-CoA:carnitine CoA-transferase CaiB-like acyl-CoA transferase